MARHWSESEVRAAVEDYFDMLRSELNGRPYNKTHHRHTLLGRLDDRSNSSVELKHQNISAVLIEMGMPYIDGYKPRFNYQRTLLPEAVAEHLARHPELHALFAADAQATPAIPAVADLLAALESPPATEGSRAAEPVAPYNPTGVNYLELEARNQVLGDAGEQFVLNFERARLIHAGKDSLADRIEQVSTTIGPSAGFDIRSFDTTGADRFIEVKTTKYGKNTPFFVTPNELRCSRDKARQYFLYRLFRFRETPRLFALQGRLEKSCVLEPSAYLACVR